jgi:cytoskeleton protein RodZ
MSDKPLAGLGEKLRGQRETRGLSLQDIADKTKIPLSILQALEIGDDSHFPAPVFVKGFLRSYAIEIGLKPEDLIGDYNLIFPVQDTPVAVPVTARKGLEDRSWLWLTIPAFILLLGAGTLAYVYWPALVSTTPPAATSLPANQETELGESQSTVPATSPDLAEPAGPVDASSAAPAPMETISPQPEGSVTASADSTAGQSITVQPPAVAMDENRPGSPGQHGETGQPAVGADELQTASVSGAGEDASLGQKHELIMKFSDDVWVQIAVDDKEVQHGLFKSGTSRTWHADKGFSLRIGNAGGVTVTFDGREMGTVGGDGKVVALVLPEKTNP